MQDMIATRIFVRAFDGHQVGRFFDDADRLGTPLRVATNGTLIALGQPKTFLAPFLASLCSYLTTEHSPGVSTRIV